MAYYTTILRQIIDIFPRHEFESLAKDYHVGQKFRSFNRWTQFMVMFIGQLSGRKSLRDLVMNVSAQTSKLYHLAIKPCSRAALARVNEKQPAALYESVFHKLLHRCRQFAPKHRFKFNGKLYLLDATVVDLCLSVFPWAKFRKAKGAIKIHVGLDGAGYLPEFISLTDGCYTPTTTSSTTTIQPSTTTCAYPDKGTCNADPNSKWIGHPKNGWCEEAVSFVPDETPEETAMTV